MSDWHIERIIANAINETARGDPDALAGRIDSALWRYYITCRC